MVKNVCKINALRRKWRNIYGNLSQKPNEKAELTWELKANKSNDSAVSAEEFRIKLGTILLSPGPKLMEIWSLIRLNLWFWSRPSERVNMFGSTSLTWHFQYHTTCWHDLCDIAACPVSKPTHMDSIWFARTTNFVDLKKWFLKLVIWVLPFPRVNISRRKQLGWFMSIKIEPRELT